MSIELSRPRDAASESTTRPKAIGLDPLLGTWSIFKPGGSGLTRVDVFEDGGRVMAHAYGSSADGDIPDWGVAQARVFADDPAGGEVWAFRADYELAHQRVGLYGYLNRGLLAIDIATTFTDNSGRRDYYSRTFFFRR